MRIPLLEALIQTANRIVAEGLSMLGWYPGILGYGGYGSLREARVRARVLMTRRGDQRAWLASRPGWRQYFDAQVPGQRVLVQLGDARASLRADVGGYIDAAIEGHGLNPGWHSAQVMVVFGRGTGRPFEVPVRIVGDDERVGIISDIDDTIIQTYVPYPLQAIKVMLAERSDHRLAVPGMAEFLHRLAPEGPRSAPVMYLSNGAWNVTSTLLSFVRRTGYPKGTPLLRAWGISGDGLPFLGTRHKLREFDRLTAILPQVRWYLVGDNGQHDPTIYTTIAQNHPDRVAGIFIRTLTGSHQLMAHGTPTPLDRQVGHVDPTIPVLYGHDGHELLRQWG